MFLEGRSVVVQSKFDAFLTKMGVSLASLGVSGVALSRNDGLKAIDILRHGEFPILGGDVYFRHEGQLSVAYANWYVEPKPSERHESYLLRSWEKAAAYIRDFPEPTDAEVLFSFVVGNASATKDEGGFNYEASSSNAGRQRLGH